MLVWGQDRTSISFSVGLPLKHRRRRDAARSSCCLFLLSSFLWLLLSKNNNSNNNSFYYYTSVVVEVVAVGIVEAMHVFSVVSAGVDVIMVRDDGTRAYSSRHDENSKYDMGMENEKNIWPIWPAHTVIMRGAKMTSH